MIFVLSVVLLSGATVDAREGNADATASKERIAKVVSVFAQALHQPDQQFGLFRVLTQDESRSALKEGAVDLNRLMEKVSAGYSLHLFENLDHEAIPNRIFMQLHRPQNAYSRETSNMLPFMPKAGSRWILIIKLPGNVSPGVIKDTQRIAPVELHDEFFGLIPLDGTIDRTGEGTPIYDDLKRMKSYFQSSKKAAPPELKSGLGKQIFRAASQSQKKPDGKTP